MDLSCNYIGRCGGCPQGGTSYADQKINKLSATNAIYPRGELRTPGLQGLRDRADLIWEERKGLLYLGLYEIDKREVLDLENCAMMSANLHAWFVDFRKLKPPGVRKGSVRLRVSPNGERGVWLDFANQDVKTLFDERNYLKQLSEMAFVEIGQRRKALIWKEGAPKLVDPLLQPWFETYDLEQKPIPLYGPVGGFSQPGFVTNRELVTAVAEAVDLASTKVGSRSWLELFCGNGNFTLALASRGYQIEGLELDELAVEGIRRSLETLPAEFAHNVKVGRADVYLKTKSLPEICGRSLLVDPPRAGLRELLPILASDPHANSHRPKSLVYVSCFTDVFLRDAEQLTKAGYKLHHLVGIDQFPHSPHCEWVSVWL